MRKLLIACTAAASLSLLSGCYVAPADPYYGNGYDNGYNNGYGETGYAYPAYVGVYGAYPERYRHRGYYGGGHYDWGYWNHNHGSVPSHWHRH